MSVLEDVFACNDGYKYVNIPHFATFLELMTVIRMVGLFLMADDDLRNPITIITVLNKEYVFEKRGIYAEPMCTYIVILLY